MKKLLYTSALVLSLFSASDAAAERPKLELEFNSSLLNKYSEEKGDIYWRNYSYTADSVINNVSNLGTYGLITLHDKFNLDEKRASSRLLFLATYGLLKTRVDFTNSLFFGHELIHFQNAYRFGDAESYFRNESTGEKMDFWETYKYILINGRPPGPAVSAFDPEDYVDFRNNPRKIEHITNPLNWQMEYSSRWVESSLLHNNKTIFDLPNFFINRNYMAGYYVGDSQSNGETTGELGDPWKYAQHMEQFTGKTTKENLDQMTGLIVLSSFLSHSTWVNSSQVGRYISTGDYKIEPSYLNTRLGKVTWDIETYQNLESFTIKPKVFFNREDGSLLGGDKVLYSVGVEKSALGNDDIEVTLGVHGIWGDFNTSTEVSVNDSGQFLELNAAYEINEYGEFFTQAAMSNGDTLRGSRVAPDEKPTFMMGFKVKF